MGSFYLSQNLIFCEITVFCDLATAAHPAGAETKEDDSMKLVSYRIGTQDTYGVIGAKGLIDLSPLAEESGATLKDALERNSLGRIRE